MTPARRRTRIALVAVIAAAGLAVGAILVSAAQGMTVSEPAFRCSSGRVVVTASVDPGRVKARRWAVRTTVSQEGRRISTVARGLRRPSGRPPGSVRQVLPTGSAALLPGCALARGQSLAVTVHALSRNGRTIRESATGERGPEEDAPAAPPLPEGVGPEAGTGETGSAGPGSPPGDETPAGSPAPAARATRSVTLGAVPAPVTEASGLAASRSNPGTVWTHNDSGGAASLYALDSTGSIRATLSLTGATNRDWEDMARGPGPAGAPDWLYAGDIGDNGASRTSIRVYRVAEPDLSGVTPGGSVASAAVGSVNLTYPDGARDAEALVVDPQSADLYVITKREARSRVYRARAPSFGGETVTLEYLGELDNTFVTAADACPDGRTVLVRSYLGLEAYEGSSVASALRSSPSPRLVEAEPQGETVAAAPDCEGYYTLSEGVRQPLIRYLR